MSSAYFSFIISFGLLALSCGITMKSSLINPNSSTVWFLLASLSLNFWWPTDYHFCSSQPPTYMMPLCPLLGLFVRSISLPSWSVPSSGSFLAMIAQLSQFRLFPSPVQFLTKRQFPLPPLASGSHFPTSFLF